VKEEGRRRKEEGGRTAPPSFDAYLQKGQQPVPHRTEAAAAVPPHVPSSRVIITAIFVFIAVPLEWSRGQSAVRKPR
jgi:hypothetical protein